MLNNQIKFKQGNRENLPQENITPGTIYLAKSENKQESYLYYGEDETTLLPIMSGETVRIDQGGTGATEPIQALKNLNIINIHGGINIGEETSSKTGVAIGQEAKTIKVIQKSDFFSFQDTWYEKIDNIIGMKIFLIDKDPDGDEALEQEIFERVESFKPLTIEYYQNYEETGIKIPLISFSIQEYENIIEPEKKGIYFQYEDSTTLINDNIISNPNFGFKIAYEEICKSDGVAIGNKAKTADGVAIGFKSQSEKGVSIGYQTLTNDGVSIGYKANAQSIIEEKILTIQGPIDEYYSFYKKETKNPEIIFYIGVKEYFNLKPSKISVKFTEAQKEFSCISFRLLTITPEYYSYEIICQDSNNYMDNYPDSEIESFSLECKYNEIIDGGVAIGYEAKSELGGAVGKNTIAECGGAVGQEAQTMDGGAIGRNAYSTFGGAIGYNGYTSVGGAVGYNAESGYGGSVGAYSYTERGGSIGYKAVSENGGAIGLESYSENGGAVGERAKSGTGFAGGQNAFAGTKNYDGSIKTYGTGGAVGNGAQSSDGGAMGQNATAGSGGAVGQNASSTTGGAVGKDAKTKFTETITAEFPIDIVVYNEVDRTIYIKYDIEYSRPIDEGTNIKFISNKTSAPVELGIVPLFSGYTTIKYIDNIPYLSIRRNLIYKDEAIARIKNGEFSSVKVTHTFVGDGSGGAVGYDAAASTGGAIGRNATAATGGAVGSGTFTSHGGAVGAGATAEAGGAVGSNAHTYYGGAVGWCTSTIFGGAVGSSAEATGGGAVGENTVTTDGFAGGYRSRCVEKIIRTTDEYSISTTTISGGTGGAIGKNALSVSGFAGGEGATVGRLNSDNRWDSDANAWVTEIVNGTGGAVGEEAHAEDGFAGGYGAKAYASGAVQLGEGTNYDDNSLQFRNQKIIDGNNYFIASQYGTEDPPSWMNFTPGAIYYKIIE